MYSAQFKNSTDALSRGEKAGESVKKAFGAFYYLYQIEIYERHDVGPAAGFGPGTLRADAQSVLAVTPPKAE